MRQLFNFERQIFGTSSMVWGEWKNQTKCALEPLPSSSQDSTSPQDTTITSTTFSTFVENRKENVDTTNKYATTTTTTTTTITNTAEGAESPRKVRTALQQAALDSFVQTHITPELLQQGLREVCGGVYGIFKYSPSSHNFSHVSSCDHF